MSTEINYLEMSDEDILAMDLEGSQELSSDTTNSDEAVSTPEEDNAVEDSTEASEDGTSEDEGEAEQTADTNPVDEQEVTEESQHEDVSTKDVKDVSKPEATIDYKAAYERLLAPFKANGKTVQVDSVEDAVSLMQMGANYNKRMQELKPNLRIVKMLGDNGLLDEAKLNMLIEVAQGKPEAIKKLVADSKLDAYSLDAETDSKYTPNDYRVNDSQIELDEVIKELQESPAFTRTADVVGNKWDAASRSAIASNPKLLRDIHAHVESGAYDAITAEIDKQRMLGRTPTGMSDLELYELTAKYMMEMYSKSQQTQNQAPVQNVREQERTAKKQALAPTKSTSSTKSSGTPDFLSMSDDEFEQYSKTGLYKTV
jgi:hypothetical protein